MRLVDFLRWPINRLVFVLSALVPRDRRLWLFGSSGGSRFADNGKWLYLHVVAKAPHGVRAVWAARNEAVAASLSQEGLPYIRMNGLRGLWTSMRAGVWVFDSTIWDIGYWTSARARKVNLWHGYPLKKVKIDIGNVTHPDRRIRHGSFGQRLAAWLRTPWAAVRHHMVIATAPEAADRMATAFDVRREDVAVTGYPRNDVLVSDEPRLTAEDTRELEPYAKVNGPVVLYMPTFRDAFLQTGHELPLDWHGMQGVLERHGATLVAKLHPRDSARLPDHGLSRIRIAPANLDPYPLLRLTDLLITDYSSVHFDFLLLDRPIVFYPYDLERYVTQDRPLYEPYEGATPGPIATTMAELVTCLDHALGKYAEERAAYADARHRLRDRAHAFQDAQSCQRTAEAIARRFVSPRDVTP